MTPKERAEKIEKLHPGAISQEQRFVFISQITAEIKAAEEVAVEAENARCTEFFLSQPFMAEVCTSSTVGPRTLYLQAKAEAYEDAAKIAERAETLCTVFDTKATAFYIAKEIRARAKELLK